MHSIVLKCYRVHIVLYVRIYYNTIGINFRLRAVLWSALVATGSHSLPTLQFPPHRFKKNTRHLKGISYSLVRVTGLEPVRHKHTPLKRACLPVPAHSLTRINYTIFIFTCQVILSYFLKKVFSTYYSKT